MCVAFRDWIDEKFKEWEKRTGNGYSRRYVDFARYLGVDPSSLTRWRNGDTVPEKEENVKALVKKLGNEVYIQLGRKIPDPLSEAFPNMSPDVRERLAAAMSEINDRSEGIPEGDPRLDEIIRDALKQNGFKL